MMKERPSSPRIARLQIDRATSLRDVTNVISKQYIHSSSVNSFFLSFFFSFLFFVFDFFSLFENAIELSYEL